MRRTSCRRWAGTASTMRSMDAVAAANLLSDPLKAERLHLGDLAAVQRRREWPTRLIQALVARLQKNVLRKTPPSAFSWLSLLSRSPLVRVLSAWLFGLGIRREHVRQRC